MYGTGDKTIPIILSLLAIVTLLSTGSLYRVITNDIDEITPNYPIDTILWEDDDLNYSVGHGVQSDSSPIDFSNSDCFSINKTAPWAVFCGDAQHTGRSKINASDNPGKIKLSHTYMWEVGNQFIVDDDGMIYISGGNLRAMYPNGTIKWNLGWSSSSNIPVMGSNNILYYPAGYKFYAIYPSNGTAMWSIDLSTICYSSAMMDDNDTIYFMSTSSDYSTLFLNAYHNNGTLKWNRTLKGRLSSNPYAYHSPTLDEDNNIYISSDTVIHSFLPNGTLRWMTENPDYNRLSSPTIGVGDAFYIQDNRDIFAFFKINGTEKWNRSKDLDSSSAFLPAIGPDGTLYFAGDTLYAYTTSGNLLWKWEGNKHTISTPVIDASGIIFLSQDHFLYAIFPNGTTKWKVILDDGFQNNCGIINKDGDIYIFGRYLYTIGKRKPTPPSNIQYDSGDSYVNLTWDYPEDDGGVIVSEYRIYKHNSTSDLELFTVLDHGINQFNDTDVINGETYNYVLTAVNTEGESDQSDVISVIPLTVPSVPLNVRTIVSDDYIEISWDPPSDVGGSAVIRYDIFKGVNAVEFELIQSTDRLLRHYQDTDVTIGEDNYYYVTAVNVKGSSLPSEIVHAVYKTIPSPPLNFTATEGDDIVLLSWESPEKNGGAYILGYNIRRTSSVNDSVVMISGLSPDTFHYNDTTVMNGITYSYNITSFTEVGESEHSITMTRVPMSVPGVPLNFSATSGDGEVLLSWLPPSDWGGSQMLYYRINRTDDLGNSTLIVSGVGDVSYQDNEVSNGCIYFYSISAVNELGGSLYTSPIEASPTGVPTPPMDAHVQYGPGFVHIFWNASFSDEGSPIIEFRIYRDSLLYRNVGSDVFELNDTGVLNGLIYSYYITSINSNGESLKSAIIQGYPYEQPVQLTAPSSPLNLSVSIFVDHVVLKWDPPSDNGGSAVFQYNVYRGLSENGSFVLLDSVSGDFTSIDDYTLTPGTLYFYYVSAVNDYSEGDDSGIVNATVDIILSDDDDDVVDVENGPNWLLISILSIIGVIALVLILFVFLRYKGNRDESMSKESDEISEDNSIDPSYPFPVIVDTTSYMKENED